ncbi:MAG: DNA primase [Microcystis sp. LE19-12.2C]|nr:DNA primase [Microcystis sp. LE19-12.2C]MCZ8085137.1 DNA primase [Paracoccaceae bacterium]
MTLSPSFLDDLRTRVSLSSVVAPHVTWDMRKSNMAKGDWWAPCPFHQEKTASFHVDDTKGFFYCFGCHAKGDLFRFLQDREGKSFIEAAEAVAHLAGTKLPARDAAAALKSGAHEHLYQILEAAAGWYRERLEAPSGKHARDYLSGRGVPESVAARWMLGYSPKTTPTLVDSFVARGVPLEQLVAAGLVIADPGKPARDRFRDRIMIPIRDQRGRVISFGGRALPGATTAKYINGPQTALFDKGRTLFNYAAARIATTQSAPLIVAEGYLDVISMVEAGFAGTVAPLGTAVTPTHITALLKITDEPIFAMDGDPAGLRSAHRVIDTSLHLLTAGKGIRFALLPDGQDPDDMIRAGQAETLRAIINQSTPMIDLLWARETDNTNIDSPERMATLEKRLAAVTGLIADTSIRTHYAEMLANRISAMKSSLNSSFARHRTSSPRRSVQKQNPRLVPVPNPEDLVLAVLLRIPALRAAYLRDLEALVTSTPRNHALRDMLLLPVPHGDAPIATEFVEAVAATRADQHLDAAVTQLVEAPTPTLRFALAEAFFRLRAE